MRVTPQGGPEEIASLASPNTPLVIRHIAFIWSFLWITLFD